MPGGFFCVFNGMGLIERSRKNSRNFRYANGSHHGPVGRKLSLQQPLYLIDCTAFEHRFKTKVAALVKLFPIRQKDNRCQFYTGCNAAFFSRLPIRYGPTCRKGHLQRAHNPVPVRCRQPVSGAGIAFFQVRISL